MVSRWATRASRALVLLVALCALAAVPTTVHVLNERGRGETTRQRTGPETVVAYLDALIAGNNAGVDAVTDAEALEDSYNGARGLYSPYDMLVGDPAVAAQSGLKVSYANVKAVDGLRPDAYQSTVDAKITWTIGSASAPRSVWRIVEFYLSRTEADAPFRIKDVQPRPDSDSDAGDGSDIPAAPVGDGDPQACGDPDQVVQTFVTRTLSAGSPSTQCLPGDGALAAAPAGWPQSAGAIIPIAQRRPGTGGGPATMIQLDGPVGEYPFLVAGGQRWVAVTALTDSAGWPSSGSGPVEQLCIIAIVAA
jgi:hypothetical protein